VSSGSIQSSTAAPAASASANGVNRRESLVLDPSPVEWPTVAFDVTKINERGRRQQRILRLTSTHIQNIRDGDNITSRHAFDDVFCVTLADAETLVISYQNAHDYTYVSPIALQIVAEINERISHKREKAKSLLATNLNQMALRFQEESFQKDKDEKAAKSKQAAGGISTIPEDEAVTAPVAETLGDGAPNGSEADSVSPLTVGPPLSTSVRGSLASSSPIASPASSASPSPRTSSSAPPLQRTGSMSRSALKLQQLFGTTQSQRLQLAVETLVLDANSDAGRARARFVKNLSVLERNPDTMLPVMRQFMDSLKTFIENKKMAELRKQMGVTDKHQGPLPGEEDMPLDARLERAVQAGVVQPAYARIMATLRRHCAPTDDAIALALARLRSQIGPDQSYYGIPAGSRNLHAWQTAVEELNDLERATLPVDKIKSLLRCAKAIYNTFNEDRTRQQRASGKAASAGQYFLSADDFFPIFTFVVAQSSLRCLDSTRTFVWNLSDKAALNGEAGYYLTVFEAAVEYIRAQPALLDEKAKLGK